MCVQRLRVAGRSSICGDNIRGNGQLLLAVMHGLGSCYGSTRSGVCCSSCGCLCPMYLRVCHTSHHAEQRLGGCASLIIVIGVQRGPYRQYAQSECVAARVSDWWMGGSCVVWRSCAFGALDAVAFMCLVWRVPMAALVLSSALLCVLLPVLPCPNVRSSMIWYSRV